MDLKSGALLVPPSVKNSSCSHPRYTSHNFITHIGIAETIEAVLILILTLGIIGANVLVIFVINNRRYSAYIHQQPRYLLTSLALNDLTIGLLITPFGLLPALFHCWPYGEIFCQIQALLRGALSQQSAVILVCMAVDRYMCALHPRRYYQHSSKKGCVAILSLTWIISLTVFGFLVLPKGYYFNNSGLMACEPFYSKPSYRILSTCSLYFPTTMVLMYCYGSSFHMSRFRLNDPSMPLTAAAHHPVSTQHHQHQHQHQHHQQLQHQHQHQHQLQHQHPHHYHHPHQHHQHMHHHATTGGTGMNPTTQLPNTPPSIMNLSMAMGMGMGVGMGLSFPGPTNMITKKIVPIQEKHSSSSTSRSMAAISLGFIVMVTPWTIQEIVAACTGSKLPPFLDFLVTYTALSNSLWNPFMYWLLNADFRRLSRRMMPNKCCPTEDTPEHKSAAATAASSASSAGGCCHINSDYEITTLPMPPEPPISRPPNNSNNGGGGGGGGGASVLGICTRSRTNSLSRSASQHMQRGHHYYPHQQHYSHHVGGGGGGGGVGYSTVRPDIEGLSEKYWGEILERTVSSGNLHAMSKNFPHHHHAATMHHHLHHNLPSAGQATIMTTSFSTKHSDLNLNQSISGHDADNSSNGNNDGNPTTQQACDLSKFSNSEPKLCEHLFHDANCAKNKGTLLRGNSGGGNGGADIKLPSSSASASASGVVNSATTTTTTTSMQARNIPDI